MREAVNQFPVVLAFIIGALGKLPIHTFHAGLHLEDVLESKLGLLHHGALIAEHHHLRQVADGTFAGNGHSARSGLLQACQNLEHGGLSRTVLAHKGYAVFFIDNVRDVFE